MSDGPASVDAVLLLAFGGPEGPADVRPFLANVTRGRPIPPARLDEVAAHYQAIGGRSPLTELTRGQARALAARLAATGVPLPVRVGMRHWTPYIHEALAELAAQGVRRVLGVILSVLQAESSWDRYRDDVARARERIAGGAPEVELAPPWGEHSGVVEAAADRVRAALAELPPGTAAGTTVIFTAHSVPVPRAGASPYAAQLVRLAGRVAERIEHRRWSVAYQSRSGAPGEPWLEPDVGDELRRLAGCGERQVVVAPVGFVCDHVEVLYDLDVEARRVATACGLDFVRAATVGDHPAFISALADLVRVERMG